MRKSVLLTTAAMLIAAIGALSSPAGAKSAVCRNCWRVACTPGTSPGVICHDCVEVPCNITVKPMPKSLSKSRKTGTQQKE
jgi:hypothetical protein